MRSQKSYCSLNRNPFVVGPSQPYFANSAAIDKTSVVSITCTFLRPFTLLPAVALSLSMALQYIRYIAL